jgi:hypothetical protein
MDQKFLYEAILGDRPDLFAAIWSVYRQFLEETNAARHVEEYFLDRQRLINDFYRWLYTTGHHQELSLIDRRNGRDRRGAPRPGAEGRRQSDHPPQTGIQRSPKEPDDFRLIKSGDDLSA